MAAPAPLSCSHVCEDSTFLKHRKKKDLVGGWRWFMAVGAGSQPTPLFFGNLHRWELLGGGASLTSSILFVVET